MSRNHETFIYSISRMKQTQTSVMVFNSSHLFHKSAYLKLITLSATQNFIVHFAKLHVTLFINQNKNF